VTTISFCLQMGKRDNVRVAMESIKAQTHPPDQIVCVEDGLLRPENEAIAREYGALYEQLPPKVGNEFRYARGHNRCAELATGDLIVLTQEDVYYPPDFVEKVIPVMERLGRGIVEQVYLKRVDPNQAPYPQPAGAQLGHRFGDNPCLVMWRADYVPMDEEYDHYMHWWGPGWTFDLERAGIRGYNNHDIWATHIDHPDSMAEGKFPFGEMLYRAKTGAHR
jgi:hypothetical protein